MSDDSFSWRAGKENLFAQFLPSVPHCAALGLVVDEVGRGKATVRIPYSEKWIGNPETGVLHGGVVTTLLDTGCGLAVFLRLEKAVRIATLDLRIDYLRPAKPGQPLIAEAECYHLTRSVAFTRALAHNGDPNEAVAHAAGTFIIDDSMGGSVP